MDRPELVRRYVRYRDEKAKIRARQKDELNRELLPFLRDVGEAVIARQGAGDSVDVILDALGSQNKTFMYEAKAEYQRGPTPPQEASEPAIAPGGGLLHRPEEAYSLFNEGQRTGVEIYTHGMPVETYYIDFVNGEPVVPDEWATHDAERRALYKKILKEIS